MPDDDPELDQLLARGRLSGRQYDEIERRVLDHVVPKRRRWLWPAAVPAAALASAAGLWLLVSARSEQEFTAKGAGPAASLAVEVGCGGATPHVCRLGDTLMFSIPAHARSGYLAAYAERLGDSAAPRIWYFPSGSGAAPRVEQADVTRVLPQGVRLGAPHAKGRYRVMAWVSDVPVDRAEAVGHGEMTLEIVD